MSQPETFGEFRLNCGKCGMRLSLLDHICPPPWWTDPVARARAEAFEECARIAETRCADFVERLAALLETGGNSVEMQSRASESAKIAAEIRRRAKP